MSSRNLNRPKHRFVLMSSIGPRAWRKDQFVSGVTRRDGFPYSILNGGGVLDAKARLKGHLTSVAARRKVRRPCRRWFGRRV